MSGYATTCNCLGVAELTLTGCHFGWSLEAAVSLEQAAISSVRFQTATSVSRFEGAAANQWFSGLTAIV
jgi:hypothetical protein